MQAIALAVLVAAIDQKAAQAVFAQAHALCVAEGGVLWNRTLCGPLMLVDPQTREAVRSRDEVTLESFAVPADVPISNTSVTIEGTRWTEVLWPVTADAKKRAVMLMHESYHRIQPELHLTGGQDLGTNGHLDTEAGRVWLRGELHALDRALSTSGAARKRALGDAIAMRAYRHSLFAGSSDEERGVEINESLAESTGIDAGLAPRDRIPYARYDIGVVEKADTYVREFPYATGVAYAELLDAQQPQWRSSITNASDLALLAAAAYGVPTKAPEKPQAQAALARYGGKAILAQEHARALRVAQTIARYRNEFTSGTTLALPMVKFSISFNPSKIEQFLAFGSVYHTLKLSDGWGTLAVDGGDALVAKAFDRCTLKLPANLSGPVIQGAGWTLTLAGGYSVVPDVARPGSYTVEKRP